MSERPRSRRWRLHDQTRDSASRAQVAACVIQAAEESARDAVGAVDEDVPVIPKPTVISRTQQLLMRPVASQKRKASGSVPAPKRAARAGKSWLDDLGDIEEEGFQVAVEKA